MRARRLLGATCRACGTLAFAAAFLAGLALTGCGSSSPPKAAGPVRCGISRTAANSPVEIMVEHGKVACSTALAIERDYTQAIRDGQAVGNGGGAPISVHGWTCQGFATPQVLKTGETSKCVKAGAELLAVLALSTSS